MKTLVIFCFIYYLLFFCFSLVFCRGKHPSDLCESETHPINIIAAIAGELIDNNRFGNSAGNDLHHFTTTICWWLVYSSLIIVEAMEDKTAKKTAPNKSEVHPLNVIKVTMKTLQRQTGRSLKNSRGRWRRSGTRGWLAFGKPRMPCRSIDGM